MCGYFCIGFTDFMFAGRILIDFTSLFSTYDFKKNDNIILSYLKKMNQLNSPEIPLNDHKKFRLNEINKIKYCFSSEIKNERQ